MHGTTAGRKSEEPLSKSGSAAICDFPRREDELMIKLMNQKRSTS
jgi:hypothetical protein